MAAILKLDHPVHTVHWHFFQMSVTNVVVIVAMLVVFVLAIALPFPARLRREGYMASWTYAFGVAATASLIVTLTSGAILALKGPGWWHFTGAGHFFNSIHLWAVELLLFFAVIHLWTKYWMAAWRGGRSHVWITGAISFLLAIPTALTGYLSQQNFDAQWLAIHAKDGFNSIGAGTFFNVTNFGQMYSYHVLLLPSAVVVLVVAHLLLVRRHGVVAPFELDRLLDGAVGSPPTQPRPRSTVGEPS